jgi:transcriptional regulator with XRE-family HTH domain
MRTQLKIFRIMQKLNQQQIAAKLGYERAYYGHVERGLQKGSDEFWARLQAAFGLTDVVIEELKKID